MNPYLLQLPIAMMALNVLSLELLEVVKAIIILGEDFWAASDEVFCQNFAEHL